MNSKKKVFKTVSVPVSAEGDELDFSVEVDLISSWDDSKLSSLCSGWTGDNTPVSKGLLRRLVDINFTGALPPPGTESTQSCKRQSVCADVRSTDSTRQKTRDEEEENLKLFNERRHKTERNWNIGSPTGLTHIQTHTHIELHTLGSSRKSKTEKYSVRQAALSHCGFECSCFSNEPEVSLPFAQFFFNDKVKKEKERK